jgi:hypothetical protein
VQVARAHLWQGLGRPNRPVDWQPERVTADFSTVRVVCATAPPLSPQQRSHATILTRARLTVVHAEYLKASEREAFVGLSEDHAKIKANGRDIT